MPLASAMGSLTQYSLVDLHTRRIGLSFQDAAIVLAQRIGDLIRHAPRPGEDLGGLNGPQQWAGEELDDGSARESPGQPCGLLSSLVNEPVPQAAVGELAQPVGFTLAVSNKVQLHHG